MPVITSNRLLFLVNRYGTEVTLATRVLGTYSPATGSIPISSNTTHTVKAYFSSYNLSEVDNDSVVMGDRKVLIPSVDTSGVALPEPDTDDTISGLGDTLVIKSVQKIYSGTDLVCYILQARE